MHVRGLQGIVRSAVLTLFLMVVIVTGWACMIAGLVWMLAERIGGGPALLAVGGGLMALILLPLSVTVMTRAPDRTRPTAKVSTDLLSGVMAVAGMPGGLRLLLMMVSALFGLLAIVALLASTRRTGGSSAEGGGRR